MIISTHRMSLVELTDRLITLDYGKLALDGPRQESPEETSGARRGQCREPAEPARRMHHEFRRLELRERHSRCHSDQAAAVYTTNVIRIALIVLIHRHAGMGLFRNAGRSHARRRTCRPLPPDPGCAGTRTKASSKRSSCVKAISSRKGSRSSKLTTQPSPHSSERSGSAGGPSWPGWPGWIRKPIRGRLNFRRNRLPVKLPASSRKRKMSTCDKKAQPRQRTARPAEPGIPT